MTTALFATDGRGPGFDLPAGYDDTPLMPWIFQIIGPIAWFAIAGLLIWRSRKNKALTFFAITFFAATTMWWQEWYADWAGYLRFSGEFALIPWYATAWAAPTKPWAVIAGYGWFIGLAIPAIVLLVNRATRNKVGAARYVLAAAITAPIFWAIDITVEAVATALNWWEYTNPMGPVITTTNGDFPLVYPSLVFVLWAVVVVFILMQRDDSGFFLHERIVRVNRMGAGLGRDVARVIAMALTFNITFWLVLVLPTILIRQYTGAPSVLVP